MPIDRTGSRIPDHIVYDSGPGPWARINAQLWRAPNGDTVSVRSMTADLRFRLGATEFDVVTDHAAAAHQLRTILER